MPNLFELMLKDGDRSAQQAAREASAIEKIAGELRTRQLAESSALILDEARILNRRSESWRSAGDRIVRSDAGLFDAVRLELRRSAEEWDGFSRRIEQSGKVAASGLRTDFEGLFRKAFRGEISTAKDVWSAFCDFLAGVFAKTLSKMASNWAGSALSSGLRTFSPMGAGEAFDLPGAVPGTLAGGVPDMAGIAGPNRASVTMALPASGRRFAMSALHTVGDIHQVAVRQPSPAGSSRTPLTVEINIENQGAPIQAERGPVRFDAEKMVIGLIVKNYNERGDVYNVLQHAKR